jgi:hypothetical protein
MESRSMRRTKRQQLLSISVSVVAVAALVALCWTHGDQLAEALRRVPLAVFAAAVGLHMLALGSRAEAWLLTLRAIDGRGAPRRVTHFASAGGFLAGTVSGHATLPLRMLLVRRLAPDDSPPLRDLIVADAPIYAIEATIAAALVPLAAGALGIPWWAALAAPLIGIVVLLLLRHAHGFAERRGIARGLAILETVGDRRKLVALVLVVSGATFARMWLLLHFTGLPDGVDHATLLFVSAGALSLLPLGPAVGPAAALVATGGDQVAAATAAGLGITGSGFLGVALYGVAALIARLHRRPARSQPENAEFSSP